MRTRDAVIQDLPALIAVDAVAQGSPERVESLRDAIAAGEAIVATECRTLLGYVVLNHTFYRNGFIPLLYVGAESRRQGVGTALLQAAEARCRTEKLFTSTNESNHPMRALLEATGYQPSGVIKNLDPGDPELVYVRFRGRP